MPIGNFCWKRCCTECSVLNTVHNGTYFINIKYRSTAELNCIQCIWSCRFCYKGMDRLQDRKQGFLISFMFTFSCNESRATLSWHKLNVPVLTACKCSTSAAGLWWRLLKSRGGVKCSQAACAVGWVIPPTSLSSRKQTPGQLVSRLLSQSHRGNGAEIRIFVLLFISTVFVFHWVILQNLTHTFFNT